MDKINLNLILEGISLLWIILGTVAGFTIRNLLNGIKNDQSLVKSDLMNQQNEIKAELVNQQNAIKAELVQQQNTIKEELVQHQTNMKEELTSYNTRTSADLKSHIVKDEVLFDGMHKTLERIERKLDNSR